MSEHVLDDFPAHRPGDLDDLALLPHRFEQLVSRVNAIEGQGTRILQLLGSMSEGIGDVRHHQHDQSKQMVDVAEQLDGLRAEVRERLGGLEARVAKLELGATRTKKKPASRTTSRRRRAPRTKKRKVRR